MTWEAVAVPREEVTPEYLYELSKDHRLVPENLTNAIDYYRAVSPGCRVVEVRDGDDTVGQLIISHIFDGEHAYIDFVPQPQYFSYGKPYEEGMRDALLPLFKRLLEGRNLRRLTARVPKSRSRTCKALKACYFRKEGVERDAVKFRGKEVEDLVIMGLLPKYLPKDEEYHG